MASVAIALRSAIRARRDSLDERRSLTVLVSIYEQASRPHPVPWTDGRQTVNIECVGDSLEDFCSLRRLSPALDCFRSVYVLLLPGLSQGPTYEERGSECRGRARSDQGT